MTVLAHLGGGHWWESLVYLAPMLTIGGWLLFAVIRDRLRTRRADRNGSRRERRAAERDERQ